MSVKKNRNAKRREQKKTLADLFCDTYVVETPACGFIQVPKLVNAPNATDAMERMLVPNARKVNIATVDGIPAYRVRPRFIQAIRGRGDSALGLYGILNYIFTESAIKENFTVPNVWLLNHNARAKKAVATEQCEINRQRKLDPAAFALRNQCANRTKNLSVSWTARNTRRLQD